jgi:hypothetical protein
MACEEKRNKSHKKHHCEIRISYKNSTNADVNIAGNATFQNTAHAVLPPGAKADTFVFRKNSGSYQPKKPFITPNITL